MISSFALAVSQARLDWIAGRVADARIDIHFYHLRVSSGRGYPLILTHGLPRSILEFFEAMPLLAAQGLDVIVPSLPGYGFSGRPPRPISAADVTTFFSAWQ